MSRGHVTDHRINLPDDRRCYEYYKLNRIQSGSGVTLHTYGDTCTPRVKWNESAADEYTNRPRVAPIRTIYGGNR